MLKNLCNTTHIFKMLDSNWLKKMAFHEVNAVLRELIWVLGGGGGGGAPSSNLTSIGGFDRCAGGAPFCKS